MRAYLLLTLCAITITGNAKITGIDAVLTRRKTMTKLERRVVAQRMVDGNIMSVYDDDSTSTQAVRIVRMAPGTKARVAELMDDKATLQAAKKLAQTLKSKHPGSVSGMTDAEIVDASEHVMDTSTKDGAVGVAIGLALAAAGAAARKKKPVIKGNS